jgi:Arc/MetJ-type ribon-helix-helix transcriptional regulator
MITTSIQLTDEQAQALERLARFRGQSVSELIHQGVDSLLAQEVDVDAERRRLRALSTIGRFSADVPDLASAHDQYLEEAFGH